jgi:hypothetical protein
LRNSVGIRLDGLRKTSKFVSQDNRCASYALLEYNSEASPLEVACLAFTSWSRRLTSGKFVTGYQRFGGTAATMFGFKLCFFPLEVFMTAFIIGSIQRRMVNRKGLVWKR